MENLPSTYCVVACYNITLCSYYSKHKSPIVCLYAYLLRVGRKALNEPYCRSLIINYFIPHIRRPRNTSIRIMCLEKKKNYNNIM